MVTYSSSKEATRCPYTDSKTNATVKLTRITTSSVRIVAMPSIQIDAPVHMINKIARGLHQVLKEATCLSLLHALVLPNGVLLAERSLDPSPLFLPPFTLIWCEHQGRIPSYARVPVAYEFELTYAI